MTASAPPTLLAREPAAGPDLRVLAAIVVTVLAWASAFVVIRGVMPYFSGGGLALGRLLVGTVGLALLMIGRRWVLPRGRDWALIAVYGLGWFGVYNVALNISETTLDAGTTSMLVNIAPILIALGGGIILREGVTRWLVIGAGLAFFGVVLIALGTGVGGFGDGSGVWWVLLAAAVYTAGVLCQKPALRRIPASQLTFMGCAIGALACLPFTPALLGELADAPTGAILGVVYLGLVPTAIAFSTWAYALGRMPASRLGVTTYAVPPLVVVMGLVAFGEVPAPLAIVGGIVCLAGVAVSRRMPRTRADAMPRPGGVRSGSDSLAE
ncbi:DMT family transporter [Homoserinimonas aerilata]|uniref:DMT family transporter n=1 Tax=Homoserinimonas aerilata TaxID=1162970 RepID=UPI001FE3D915|nr:DMT family transporter [Homoserinimonas aerilata]